jgi:hypothetical protein
LDASEVKASSYTETFEEVFPYYLAIGMTYEQFWCDTPELVVFYRKADDIRKRRVNEELWLAGIYTSEALASTVGNMFSKGSKYEYPSEPKPITLAEFEERKEREQRLKMEKIKAKFTARALSINASKGTEK